MRRRFAWHGKLKRLRMYGTAVRSSVECERFEFEAALEAAADPIALISDNAHASTALPDLAAEREMPYGYFHETPRDHFYPGAGLGIATARTG